MRLATPSFLPLLRMRNRLMKEHEEKLAEMKEKYLTSKEKEDKNEEYLKNELLEMEEDREQMKRNELMKTTLPPEGVE